MENFAMRLAIEQKVTDGSSKYSFPIYFLKEDFAVIERAYELLSESVTNGVPIPPSGEWLLDNFYLIEEQVSAISNGLKLKKYKKLPSVRGVARIYLLARELVSYTDGSITKDNVVTFLNAYETKKALQQEEIYELPTMIQIALIEHIKNVASKIIAEQLQKFKVESLVERVIQNKEMTAQKFHSYKSVSLDSEATSYVEYMIYLLKKMGTQGRPFLDILEEEIAKVGTTSSEIIQSEHYALAVQRVSMSNSILSMKNVSRLNWLTIFEAISPIEKILSQDELYVSSDFETKEMYREKIRTIAKKEKVSEIYVASNWDTYIKEKQGEGKENRKSYVLFWYLSLIYLPTLAISVLISPIYFWVLLIPVSEAVILVVNRMVTRFKKPRRLPRLEKISEEVNTFVIVPTLLNSKERTRQMVKNLEIYYLSNKMPHLYFCLLGDVSEENSEVVAHDTEVMQTGLEEINKLNEKYRTNIFHFIYRKRVYNPSQGKWLGYERKRGMICEFNHYLLRGEQGTFQVNTIDNLANRPNIKYVITLDADTELILDSAQKLIGTMEHPWNTPVIQNGIVTKGYALVQPKVGISIESATATTFAKLFAGSGGIDIYSTAESNVYQDLFGEAIFTGKGIYNVEVFDKLLTNEIPENTVLSHDLLEGSYLRTGLASDIEVIDGFPGRVNSYFLRLHRWTRGDWQILKWLKNKKINGLSKYKITDNLRRSLVDIFTLTLFFCGFFWIPLILIFFPFLLEIEEKVFSIFGKLGFVLFNKSFLSKIFRIGLTRKTAGIETGLRGVELFKIFRRRKGFKNFAPVIQGLKASFMRCFIQLILLPYRASLLLSAIVVTLYRVFFSKKHLLEWVTAADAEKVLGKDIKTYLKEMILAPLLGIALFLTTLIYNPLNFMQCTILFFFWFLSPWISYYISKPQKEEVGLQTQKLSQMEKVEIQEIARKTWDFFDTYMTEKNSFLPPDNYQENRKNKVTNHTSSTNIGLGLMAIVSAKDFGFLSEEEMLERLDQSLQTIESLEKWNGHLYNWYQLQTKETLYPRFVSTVDSGNFVGYLYVVKSAIQECSGEHQELLQRVDGLIENTDFSKLFDFEKNLFSIGFDERENRLVDSYYDLLASEARQASFVAIGKRDVPYKHWFNLGRALTTLNGYKGLVSWSGTSFEYFMPYMIMPSFPYTLLDETYRFSIYSQKEYAKKLNLPWGISESAFYLLDLNYNYQYKAFGVPWLGLKRGLKEDVVVAPYASIMTIEKNPKDVLKNLKELKKRNAYDKFGFYESIDFTPKRLEKNHTYQVVKTYMAHHQALILLALNNYLHHNILQRRFMENPEMKAMEILLQEKVPQNIVFTKEKKEKIPVLKYQDYEEINELVIHKAEGNVNIGANDHYTMLINDKGEGYSKLDDIYLCKYHQGYQQSSIIYVKNVDENVYWSNTLYPVSKEPDAYEVIFSSSESQFYRKDGNVETVTKMAVSSEENVEIKQVEFRNTGETLVDLEVVSYEEVTLAEKNSDIAHPAYQNLFLCTEEMDHKVLIEKKFHDGSRMYLTNFATSQNENLRFEVELDKCKVIGRNRSVKNPIMMEESKMFSNEISSMARTVVAIRTSFALSAGESVTIDYYKGVSRTREEIEAMIIKYDKKEAERRLFEMAKSRSVVENRFFGFKAKNIILYHQILSLIQNGSTTREKYERQIAESRGNQRDLWKYGISGDDPIILVKIKNVNDVFVIKELLICLEYLAQKKIKVDLVLLDEEKGKERYVSAKIIETVHEKNLSYLLNQNGGVHLLNATQIETRRHEPIICLQ